MFLIAMALIVVAGLLVLVEMLWRESLIKRANGRALVHILVACWVAFWPLFLSFTTISILAMAMFLVVVMSRTFNIFKAIHKAKRPTIGDLLFPLAILACAQLANNGAVFAIAMLQLGLADGLASLIGSRTMYKPYKILGQQKSVGGTLTFVTIAVCLVVASFIYKGTWGSEAAIMLVVLPAVTAAAENISVFGLDDLTVPLLTVVLLNSVL